MYYCSSLTHPLLSRPKYAPPSVVQSSSVNRLHQGHGPSYNGRVQAANASMGPPSQSQHSHHEDRYRGMGGGTVPKLVVEEKEQEILAKEETISVSVVNFVSPHDFTVE